eukprot:7309068-Prymnesium_polylepis.1
MCHTAHALSTVRRQRAHSALRARGSPLTLYPSHPSGERYERDPERLLRDVARWRQGVAAQE